MNQSSSKPKSSPALLSATGRDYAEWFQLLDAWGAPGRGYREIAGWLVGQGVSDWWAQKLIVEYEQDRGLRQPGARTGDSFAGGASKTVPVSIDRLYAAFADSELRRCWLPDLELTERTGAAGAADQVRRRRRRIRRDQLMYALDTQRPNEDGTKRYRVVEESSGALAAEAAAAAITSSAQTAIRARSPT
jgi:hypothetical protein